MSKIKQFFNTTITKFKSLPACITAAAVCGITSPTTLAATTTVDTKELVGKIVDIVFDIFFYIGVLLLAWAIGQLVLAFKNEDADSKSRAMMLLVVSIVLMGIKPLFDGLGLLG